MSLLVTRRLLLATLVSFCVALNGTADGQPAGSAGTGAGLGCDDPALDTDGDGTPDCHDGCPTDPLKISAGVCGCGILEQDGNGDGFVDCAAGVILFRAVKRNPTCVGGANGGQPCRLDCECDSLVCGGDIPPTHHVLLNPGGTIVVDIFLAAWSRDGNRLTTWQVNPDFDELVSADHGSLLVYTGVRCCLSDAECADLGVPCVSGICPGAGVAAPGAIVNSQRADYVFAGFPNIGVTDPMAANFVRFGGLLLMPNGLVYSPPPRYAATLILVASTDASGTFRVTAHGDTILADEDEPIRLHPLQSVPLVVSIVAPVCGNDVCEPGESASGCSVDCQRSRRWRWPY